MESGFGLGLWCGVCVTVGLKIGMYYSHIWSYDPIMPCRCGICVTVGLKIRVRVGVGIGVRVKARIKVSIRVGFSVRGPDTIQSAVDSAF